MKQKFISITSSVNGEPVEALSKSPASIDQLMAILQLCDVGSVITVVISEREIDMPNIPNKQLMSEDCLVIHYLSCAIVDSDTGEVLGKHDYKTGCEAIADKDSLLSLKRLSSWLSSFHRGCYKKDNVTIQISYYKETIF